MAQFNFRLFLRPTAIGKSIIDRLNSEGADRQADSRRWIELGYALEQAGFRLDGTVVYQGGQIFSSDHPGTIPAIVHTFSGASSVPAAVDPAPTIPLGTTVRQGSVRLATAMPAENVPFKEMDNAPGSEKTTVAPDSGTKTTPVADEMSLNLRNLSL